MRFDFMWNNGNMLLAWYTHFFLNDFLWLQELSLAQKQEFRALNKNKTHYKSKNCNSLLCGKSNIMLFRLYKIFLREFIL